MRNDGEVNKNKTSCSLFSIHKMEGQTKRSFFLVLCVFILYHDMCSLAMTMPKKKKIRDKKRGQSENRRRGRGRDRGNRPGPPGRERWNRPVVEGPGRGRWNRPDLGGYPGRGRWNRPDSRGYPGRGRWNRPGSWGYPGRGRWNRSYYPRWGQWTTNSPIEVTTPWNENPGENGGEVKEITNFTEIEVPVWNITEDSLTDEQYTQVLDQDEKESVNTYLDTLETGAYGNDKGFEKVLADYEKTCDQHFMDDLMGAGYNMSNEKDICDDWQDYDGTTCVCSDQCTTSRDINMGVVCDTKGNRYPNLCDFNYKMCSAQIVCTSTIASCGVCNTLKLTGSEVYQEDSVHGLGIFRKDNSSNTWTAVDDHGTELKLFYSEESKTWVVGSSDMTKAGIVFKNYTLHPQDSNEGAVVYRNDTYGVIDAFLHFECMEDSTEVGKRDSNNPQSRKKRFAFLIAMAVISIVATVAQVTVTAVQHHRGCLFYPSVCHMKKEIKNQLRPEVEALKRTFNSIIGEPLGFKGIVHAVFQKLLDLKDKMVDLRKLEKEFRDLSETIGPDLKYLSPEISNDFNTTFHDDWVKALGTQTAWGIVGLMYVQMPLELISLLASTASKAAMAFAAFGAVLSVIAAVISIVVSWKNEKSQRDQLRRVKRNLIDARQKLKTALSHVKAFQINFYRTVIYPMKKFTYHMRNYDSHFQKFYTYLRNTFGSTMAATASTSIYSKIKRNSITTIKDRYLTPLNTFVSTKLDVLKAKIKAYKETEKLITLIRNNVNEQRFPKDILSLVNSVDKQLAAKLVPNEFSVLKFIAEKVLNTKDCYWGYDLKGIRAKSVNIHNYKCIVLCNSPELDPIETTFQNLTGQNMSPDRILLRIQHERFGSNFQKLRFLSDHILASKPCYWGYNLHLMRQDKISKSELNEAKLSTAAFSSLQLLLDNFRPKALCTTAKVCNPAWQSYVLCLLDDYDGGNMCKGASNCPESGVIPE